jgi:hypothetical protein
MEIEECQAELHRTIPGYDPTLALPRVIVWHNAFARMPFPTDLFRGPLDSHLGVARCEKGVFQQVTFRGDQLPASVRL